MRWVDTVAVVETAEAPYAAESLPFSTLDQAGSPELWRQNLVFALFYCLTHFLNFLYFYFSFMGAAQMSFKILGSIFEFQVY